MKALLGTLLIAHGLVHIPLPLAPGADGESMRLLSLCLVALSALAFLIAGLSYFGFLVPATWFRGTLVAASAISLIWLGLFWHPWLVVGLALDLAFLLAVMLKWTPAAK